MYWIILQTFTQYISHLTHFRYQKLVLLLILFYYEKMCNYYILTLDMRELHLYEHLIFINKYIYHQCLFYWFFFFFDWTIQFLVILYFDAKWLWINRMLIFWRNRYMPLYVIFEAYLIVFIIHQHILHFIQFYIAFLLYDIIWIHVNTIIEWVYIV